MFNQKMTTDMTRTPFVKQKSGKWSLFLISDKTIEWGHRFDAGIGYRVFIKFQDSLMANTFLDHQAAKMARLMRAKKSGPPDEELVLAKKLEDMAKQVERLNELWAAAGVPDKPLDKIGTAGNA